ncbi:MAG TPA: GlsB/YeaQ/YmgE family stress response membrane protein [Ktedonobacterales bacterium]|nr:GlsB/YeaQ/YmgE family stress response membrane protein [Ktedonobacterales bacterium]
MVGTIIAWIVIGAIAGWLASLVVRGTGLGLVGDIIVGIIGGIIGGIILEFLFGVGGVSGFNIGSVITAFIGAVVLLLIVRLFTGNRTTARV